MTDLLKSYLAVVLLIAALLAMAHCAPAAENTLDGVRAQLYFRAILGRGHTNHAPDIYVRDAEFPNTVAELACRELELKPGQRVDYWLRLPRPDTCRTLGCRAALPLLPTGEPTETWLQIPARQRQLVRTNLAFGTVRFDPPTGGVFLGGRAGYWTGKSTIVIPAASRLRELFP